MDLRIYWLSRDEIKFLGFKINEPDFGNSIRFNPGYQLLVLIPCKCTILIPACRCTVLILVFIYNVAQYSICNPDFVEKIGRNHEKRIFYEPNIRIENQLKKKNTDFDWRQNRKN